MYFFNINFDFSYLICIFTIPIQNCVVLTCENITFAKAIYSSDPTVQINTCKAFGFPSLQKLQYSIASEP